MSFHLTFTQCKQLAANYSHYPGGMRKVIKQMQDQPEFIRESWELYNLEDGMIAPKSPLTLYTMKAVQTGGCDSGAYMPAVTYYYAEQTMADHGDAVLEYIKERAGELPPPPEGSSWFDMAVFYLSYAVELWCCQFNLDGVDWD